MTLFERMGRSLADFKRGLKTPAPPNPEPPITFTKTCEWCRYFATPLTCRRYPKHTAAPSPSHVCGEWDHGRHAAKQLDDHMLWKWRQFGT